MSVETQFRDGFGHLHKALQDSVKNQFDEEAFAVKPDYQKLARLGSLVDNPQLNQELAKAEEQVIGLVINLLNSYGISADEEFGKPAPAVALKTPVVPQIEAPKHEKPHEEEEVRVPTEVDPAIKKLVDHGETDQLLSKLRQTKSLTARREIFSMALYSIGSVGETITPQIFHRRIKSLFSMDDTRDSDLNFTHGTMLGILEEWLNSEDEGKAEMATYIFDHLSTTTLEKMLGRPNLDTCSPARMTVYMRNSAFRLDVKEDYERISKDEFIHYKSVEDPGELDEVLEQILERDNETPGFMDDVVTHLRDQGYLQMSGRHGDSAESYLQNAIIELATGGSEAAFCFLQSAWLDHLV